MQHLPLVKGTLWIADLGYFALVRLAQLSKAGVYFLMPLKDGVVMWLADKRVDILEVLQAHAQQEEQEFEIVLLRRANRGSVACSRAEPPRSKSSAVTTNKTSMRADMAPASRNANATGLPGPWSLAMSRRTCSANQKPWCCCGCAGKAS